MPMIDLHPGHHHAFAQPKHCISVLAADAGQDTGQCIVTFSDDSSATYVAPHSGAIANDAMIHRLEYEDGSVAMISDILNTGAYRILVDFS